MDDQLSKILEDFCKTRDSLNTSNVTGKTPGIIARFIKAVNIAEKIVANPPKRDTSYDPELHLKSSTYAPLKKEKLEKEWANPVKKVIEEVKVPKKRGPKPKNK